MILTIVAIRDAKVGAFMRPAFVPARGAAVRSFSDEVKRESPDNEMHRHPEDFDLWLLGTWDDQDGSFSCGLPERICGGVDFV